MADEDDVVLAFDMTTRKPGCILVQRALGGTLPSDEFHRLFPTETWQVTVGDCVAYRVPRALLQKISTQVRVEHELRGKT